MRKYIVGLMTLACAVPLLADDLRFDWSQMPTNQPPAGCISTLTGDGKPGTWRILMDDVPLPMAPFSPNAPATAPKSVVAQIAWDATDNHYPLLVLNTNNYGDFIFSTRFKIADGLTEQIAGVAFRMQDERNYYFIRANAIGNNFYFYRVFKGMLSSPIGNNMKFTRGVWHQLTVECAGPKIHILLDGSEALPMLTDPTFSAGKIALLTKSDSISYFTDTHLTYTPREPFAQLMVRDAMKENKRLVGMKIFMATPQSPDVRIVASDDQTELGKPGQKFDADVINRGVNYISRDKNAGIIYVTMPLRDRNGDAVASVRLVMKSFKGQTEDNALERARPIMQKLQARSASVDQLY